MTTEHEGHAKVGFAVSEKEFEVARLDSQPKDFSWPRLFAGDCTLSGNNLRVFDNGTAEWRASVMSQDDGEDSWGCRFQFQDDHGVVIWQHGWIWSPTLHPTPVDWVSLNQIFFPSYIFQSLSRVVMEYHC
ncbi:DUF6294 family protein [Devosia sp. ZB163]|uniref:DUF6294 family protein n=1 Tax=Devosia sp. ZB163 TaxID=3025938 RepID=UPI002360A3CF|nr:DUF6294 family protein [Devosia sp. ZB163]MDC9825341.1 DUF6294 family protein [Devosia sp. ZB163]